MKIHIGFAVAMTVAMSWGISPPDAQAYEQYVLGGDEHPWQASWETSGAVTLMDTSRVLQPLKLDPTQNIAMGFQDRGGFSWKTYGDPALGGVNEIFDGDSTTVLVGEFQLRFVGRVSNTRPAVDLGESFPVHRIVFYPRSTYPDRYLDRFRLHINDGTNLDNLGRPVWQLIREEHENIDPVVETKIPLQLIQFVYIYPWQNRQWEIAELEIYGEGYVPNASYTSDIVDFGEIAS